MAISGAVARETSPQIVTGAGHTCALLTDGTVRCWGANSQGQLGDGTTDGSLHPVQVLASGTAGSVPVVLGGVTQISASGGDYTCALLTDGTVRCWGANNLGQLGDGTTDASLHPVQVLASGTAGSVPVVPLTGVTQIATGASHTCALLTVLTDSTVRCWGRNDQGQIGDGTQGINRLNPVQVLASGTAGSVPLAPLTGVTQIAAGAIHTCALLTVLTDSTVSCWGANNKGQMGDGTQGLNRLNPVQVLASGTALSVPVVPLTGVTQITVGEHYGCALLADGTVRCWGVNWGGQLGDGTPEPRPDRLIPVQVLASGMTQGTDVQGGVTQIAAGYAHTCALLTDDTVRCWGANWAGQLGDGTTGGKPNPVQVLASGTAGDVPVVLGGVTQIATSSTYSTHTCALLSDGTVRCWGANSAGQLGDGTSGTIRLRPVMVLTSGTAALDPVEFSVGILTDSSGAAPSTLSLVCSSNVQVGASMACTVTGGDPGIDILWRAAYNPVFAGEGVTLDASGSGEFSFTVPAAALGQELTVELVEWIAPVSLGVVGGPVPSSVPSGEGPVPVWTLGLLALVAFGLLRRGMRVEA